MSDESNLDSTSTETVRAELESAEPSGLPAAQPHRDALVSLLRVMGPIIFVAAAFWIGNEIFAGASTQLVQRVILPCAMLALVCAVALRNELRWAQPARRLRTRLDEIRTGAAAIESLSDVSGPSDGVTPLVEPIRAMLLELKQQRQQLAELNAEISQRVASRTDALERMCGSLRAQATRDALTGLLNRRMFDMALPKLHATCAEEGTVLTVMMMDLDRFKALNDTLGHAAGDELLRDIGQLIRSTLRPKDMAFRLGGDEFVVLMPGASEEACDALAARLSSLADALCRTRKTAPPPGLSIGIARGGFHAPTPESIVAIADKNLYDAKAARKSTRPAA